MRRDVSLVRTLNLALTRFRTLKPCRVRPQRIDWTDTVTVPKEEFQVPLERCAASEVIERRRQQLQLCMRFPKYSGLRALRLPIERTSHLDILD